MRRAALVLLLMLGALGPVSSAPAAEPKVSLAIRPAAAAVARGGELPVTVEAVIATGWHINSHQPTEKFLVPTTLTLQLPEGVSAAAVEYPSAKTMRFAFAGDLELRVYEGTVPLRTTIRVPAAFAGDAVTIDAALRYQACDDTTCLPPASVRASLAVPVGEAGAVPAGATSSGAPGGAGDASTFARLLDESGLLITLGAMLLLGVGLNLTPCVYPLISVTIAYFGAGHAQARGRVAWLAGIYVLGIALSFSALGLVAALSGGLFGAALQRPVVVVAIAALMIALALGSFGLYQVRVPAALMRWAGGTTRGAAGALFMGLTMGIVAAPCVGPIMVGLLVFVGSRQDALLGFALFFFLALGMGLPYVALALAAGSIRALPRSGEWLVWTEHLFGWILLCLAAYFLSTIAPAPLRHWMLPAAVAAAGLHLGFLDRAGRALRGFPALKAAVGIGLLAVAVWLIRPADPAQAIAWEPFERWVANRHVDPAERPTLLEFGAEWCIPCREMETTTYVDADVVREAARFQMVKADLTEESDASAAMTREFAVRGVPTVILLAPDGGEHRRMVGYVGPDEMLAAMRAVR